MFTRASVITACAAMLGIGALAPVHARGTWRNTTYVTFSGSVALPGITLPAGTYIFERGDQFNTNIVEVRSRDGSRGLLLTLTQRTARPAGWPANRHILLGETPAGGIPPVIAWYPADQDFGHRFMYPTNR
jgi:hypothetical protein